MIDCANGAAYKVAPTALFELGAEVFPIGVDPNGFNINEEVGSTDPAALRAAVLRYRADIGIALDGDADRLVIIDEKGQIVDGDQVMALIATAWKSAGTLSKPGVVATVMSNLGLERYLKGISLGLERTKVGDRYVVEAMRRLGYNVGGEQSGHLVLADYSTTGDGLIAALQVLAELVRTGQPLSKVCHLFDAVPQRVQNVRTEQPCDLEAEPIALAIKAAEKRLGNKGRLLVRPSGTEPVVRIMAECDDAGIVDSVLSDVSEAISKAARAA